MDREVVSNAQSNGDSDCESQVLVPLNEEPSDRLLDEVWFENRAEWASHRISVPSPAVSFQLDALRSGYKSEIRDVALIRAKATANTRRRQEPDEYNAPQSVDEFRTRVANDEAHLRGSNLDNANLKGCRLIGLDLRYSFLRGCDLRDSNLFQTDLEGADFYEANLIRANL